MSSIAFKVLRSNQNAPTADFQFQSRDRHGNMSYIDIMSIRNYKSDRLSKEEARKLVVKIAREGRVLITWHASQRFGERGLIMNDVMNVLLSDSMRVSDGEPHLGGYTYRCATRRLVVAVGFTVRGDGLVVITVFKTERKD